MPKSACILRSGCTITPTTILGRVNRASSPGSVVMLREGPKSATSRIVLRRHLNLGDKMKRTHCLWRALLMVVTINPATTYAENALPNTISVPSIDRDALAPDLGNSFENTPAPDDKGGVIIQSPDTPNLEPSLGGGTLATTAPPPEDLPQVSPTAPSTERDQSSNANENRSARNQRQEDGTPPSRRGPGPSANEIILVCLTPRTYCSSPSNRSYPSGTTCKCGDDFGQLQ